MPSFTNGVGGKQGYISMLAVSFRPNDSRSWSKVKIMDSLNFKLVSNPSVPKPVVICELSKRYLPDTRFYVELRTPDDKKRLLALNGKRIECAGVPMWPTIEPWGLPSSSSHRPDGYRDRDRDSSSRTTHQHHEKTHQSDRHDIHEHPERNTRDGDSIFRPPKRPRVPTSGSPSSKKTVLDIHKKIGSIAIPNGNSHAPKYKIILTKNPPSYTPKSFKDYLNNHIKETKMVGVSDGDRPSIVTCYESPTSNTCDGWIMEARTAKIADSVVNHLSGKLVLSGTRLFFQHKSNALLQRPLASPRPSSYAENANGKLRSPSSLPKPNWKQQEIHVYLYMDISAISLEELSSFINSFMKKAGLFDCDVVVESRILANKVCRFLCISGDAAQKVVDELHDVPYKNSKLKLARHNTFQKQTGDAADDMSVDKNQEGIETKKKAVAPSNAVRRISVTTEGTNESSKTSSPATDTESAKCKAQSQNLTKQLMILLKENKVLKREKEKLMKELRFGSQKEPIVLADSSELEALKAEKAKRDKELAAMKDTCDKLKKQATEATKAASAEYQKSLFDIHESWKKQTIQIHELQETIKRLKGEQKKEAAEKEKVKSELEEQRKENREMSQALRVGTVMLHEERAITRQMQKDIVELRKGKKRAEKELRNNKRSLSSEVKQDEDKYDA
eukprot:CAMPEP_0116080480 /NCGR_PEP_ID=MMETSP0327-20121206/1698_1 /TAXON_ID=44447 /ORGANISM="Pseudo-nitzschia delicatissima, Strain B596" /LENGTH=674 /DNA_ID=CAMNT_0003571175 /DNA_START=138 /DNA_END=2162 /DNA_ORIENTATION=+